ncbi:hypothetical protein BDD12DRAFT_807790 [Trichophaea hybrida]|nr:hypothetical protein BDD12DRAFT_807790 [Trichophaea hybrida]
MEQEGEDEEKETGDEEEEEEEELRPRKRKSLSRRRSQDLSLRSNWSASHPRTQRQQSVDFGDKTTTRGDEMEQEGEAEEEKENNCKEKEEVGEEKKTTTSSDVQLMRTQDLRNSHSTNSFYSKESMTKNGDFRVQYSITQESGCCSRNRGPTRRDFYPQTPNGVAQIDFSAFNLVLMQLAVYQELSECSVYSALQLAVRQDLCLWIIATWLWQEHEVIILPVSPDMMMLLPPNVSCIAATVSHKFIRMPCCDIQWQPLNKIQVKEKNLIAEKNQDGGAVMWKDDHFQEVPKYVDKLASRFQHPNLVSHALIGRLDWKIIHVLR